MKTQHQHRQAIRQIVTQQLEELLSPEAIARLIERIVVKDWTGNEANLGTCLVHLKYSQHPNTTDLSSRYDIPPVLLEQMSHQQLNQMELQHRMRDTDRLLLVDGWGRETICRFMGSPEYPSAELRQTQLHLYLEQLGRLETNLYRQYLIGQLAASDCDQQLHAIRVDRQRIEALMA